MRSPSKVKTLYLDSAPVPRMARAAVALKWTPVELRKPFMNGGSGHLEGLAFLDSARTTTACTGQHAPSMGVGFLVQVSESVAVDLAASRQLQGKQGPRNLLNLRTVASGWATESVETRTMQPPFIQRSPSE